MKRIIAAVFALSLIISLASCSSGSKTEETQSTSAPVSEVTEQAENNIYMVLVNKEHKLPDNWPDMIELATGTNSMGEDYQVEKAALEAFEKLRAALLDEGIDIELDSTYRTVEYQQKIWERP